MKKAIIEIKEILIKSGLSEIEANALLARLLEEEAELFIECQKELKVK